MQAADRRSTPEQPRLFVKLAAAATLAALFLVLSTSVASASPGQVYAFGYNYYGQLASTTSNLTGSANSTPTPAGLPGATGPVVQMSAGADHSLAVTSTGQLYTFGSNLYGQLGNTSNSGMNNANPTPAGGVGLPGATGPVVQMAAGAFHSLVVTSTGQLYAFGNNFAGQLGSASNDGTGEPNPTPALVTLTGATGPVAQVAAGYEHSLAVTSTGQLYAFGINQFGQLGSTINNISANPNPIPEPVGLPGATGPVVQVAAGGRHTLAVTSTGQLYAFGENRYGQLGSTVHNGGELPNPTPAPVSLPGATGPVVQVAAGREHSLAVTSTGQLYAFGENNFGQLGNNGTGSVNFTPAPVSLPGATGPVVQVAAGNQDSLAVTSTGQLYAFGENRYGQLGNVNNSTTTNANPTPTLVALPFGATIDTVARGPVAEHTLALVSELAVLSSSLPAGQVGVPYHASAVSAGGTPAFSWRASGLPAGLLISPDGQIIGTPTTAGASGVVLGVSDIFGVSASSASIPLTIAPAATISKVLPGAGPSSAQLKASLFSQLIPKGKTAKIAALSKKHSYSYSFKALSAGKLTVNWYFLPKGAHVARKAKPKPVLEASGRLSFSAPATKKLTIKLTRKGISLLKHRKSVKLTAKGSFTPTGKSPITAKREFTLKR